MPAPSTPLQALRQPQEDAYSASLPDNQMGEYTEYKDPDFAVSLSQVLLKCSLHLISWPSLIIIN